MSKCASVCVLMFALIASVGAQEKKEEPKIEPKKEELKLSKDEEAVIDLTNAERKKADLMPLKPNLKLMTAARDHAANMAKQDKFEHNLDGKEPADRVKDAGYIYSRTGENIAWNPKTPKEVVQGWMNSPPHRENILKPEYTEVGVAVAKNKKGEGYWVQVFGTPRKK
jgi:uncharacterized protein YkwD